MKWKDFPEVVRTISLGIIAISAFAMMMSQANQLGLARCTPTPAPTMYQMNPETPIPVYEAVPQPKETLV